MLRWLAVQRQVATIPARPWPCHWPRMTMGPWRRARALDSSVVCTMVALRERACTCLASSRFAGVVLEQARWC